MFEINNQYIDTSEEENIEPINRLLEKTTDHFD